MCIKPLRSASSDESGGVGKAASDSRRRARGRTSTTTPLGRWSPAAVALSAALAVILIRRVCKDTEWGIGGSFWAFRDVGRRTRPSSFVVAAFVVLCVLLSVWSVLAALLRRKFGPTFPGGPPSDLPAPSEAVPIWRNPDLSLLNKLLEYLFPVICPVGTMTGCPVLKPNQECTREGRDAIRKADEGGYPPVLDDYDEEVVRIDRKGKEGNRGQLEVVLLKPRKGRTLLPGNDDDDDDGEATSEKSAPPPPPLILWIHGGGFVVGSGRDSYVASLMKGMTSRGGGGGKDDLVKTAVWASVEYRLAPEHPYPAAADDCLLALEHLLSAVEGYSWSGVHVAGASAGGHLVAVTGLWALKKGLRVDSIYCDVPAFPTNSGLPDDNSAVIRSVFDSDSYRRNWYTRITGVGWSEWFWGAYTGRPRSLAPDGSVIIAEGKGGLVGTKARSKCAFYYCGGALSEEEWREASELNGKLPPLLVLTSRGDIFRDGALPLMEIYKKADGSAEIQHFDFRSSHATGYLMDKETARRAFDAWGRIVHNAVDE